nr:CDP-glycerol glycerophosphotransferase family protein [Acetatifactor muris]
MKACGNAILFVLCRVIPIQDNKIAVCTFEGRGGFGCNPKYIVEELHRRNPEYRFVWLINDYDKQFPTYIKKVKNTVWNRARHLATAKIWLDNYRKPYGTIKRKGQYYINTWHGTIGFKATGLWRGDAFSKMAYLVSKNDSNMIDYVLIDSEWCSEMFPDGLVYYGDFLKSGAPRCDVLYGNRKKIKEKFKKQFHVMERNAKFIMYAPTFRERQKGGARSVYSQVWSLDFEKLMTVLQRRFGGIWYVCIRVHPQLADSVQKYMGERLIDLSNQDDMYEVLAAMDILITDYSSVAMDASFGGIPVFIYADDIEEYAKDRGSLLWELSEDTKAAVKNNKRMTPGIDAELPYGIARNNEELEDIIIHFDMEAYERKMEKFKSDVQLVFDGQASGRVADKIERLIKEV